MYEEPEAVKELLSYISDFYIMVTKKQLYYLKPEIYVLMDDDAAYRAPFFSLRCIASSLNRFTSGTPTSFSTRAV
jgi:hypothetical protein